MSRSSSATAQLNKLTTEPEPEDEVEVEVEIMDTVCPPSPASTVGIPRRRSTLSLMEQPSTIRLCSPTPTLPIAKAQVDELPFFGTSTVKERRSMAPIRQAPIINIHTRKSMPAIAGGSASITNIYPPLPVDIPPVPPIPGAYQKSSPQKPFGFSVSNADFSSAAQQVISDMQAKMQARGIGTTSFGEELLKGKSAEMDKLVHTTRGLGEGGWGLRNMASSSSIQDRYAAAHQKDFARYVISTIKLTSECNRLASLGKRQQSQISLHRLQLSLRWHLSHLESESILVVTLCPLHQTADRSSMTRSGNPNENDCPSVQAVLVRYEKQAEAW